MTSALEAAGATREPSEYATLSMDRHMTGMWTQRSPLRDADVPYLYNKFYSASRFDSIIDGVNREVTAKLTVARRYGTSRFNTNTFPACYSFYSFKRIVLNGVEVVRVIADGQDDVIYDATAFQKSTIMTKGAGAGKARFCGVNTSLYIADGVENKKWLQPAGWTAQTALATSQYQIGTYIIDSNRNLQYLTSFNVGTLSNVQGAGNSLVLTFSGTNFNIVAGMSFTLTGVGTAAFLNNKRLVATSVSPSGGNFIVTAVLPHVPYASAADTGTATTTDVGTPVTTGGSVPTWAGGVGATTTDGLSTWKNYGNPLFDWGPPAAPLSPPSLSPNLNAIFSTNALFWTPFLTAGGGHPVIMDGAGFIWAMSLASFGPTGAQYPNFPTPGSIGATGQTTVTDGTVTWLGCMWFGSSGSSLPSIVGPTSWQAARTPVLNGTGGDVLVDRNGNLQMASLGAGATGGAEPTWNTNVGGLTTDNGISWLNLGPYLAISFAGRQYGYAFHCVDGSVSTMSPLTLTTHSLLGGVAVSGVGSTSAQVDSIWIFHTPNGQSTPLFIGQLPNPGAGAWTFYDFVGDTALNPFIAGPQNGANNPPPIGMTAPVYHLGRIFAIYQNTVVASGGPNVLVGNGNTAFAALSTFPITEQPYRLFSGQTSAGPVLFIWASSNIWAIVGAGTLTSPFQQASVYMKDVGILSYDAVTQVGSSWYAFTGKNKLVSLDPGAGYVEVGFPIGDQFMNITTGTGGKIPSGYAGGALYSPSSTFVTWAELTDVAPNNATDTALYVCDGTFGWFRYAPVSPPESGFVWSPRAVIGGGTSAVQGVETSPGVTQLLIAPKAGTTGPILFRDSSVRQDWVLGAYASYPSYDVKGSIVLCQSGEVAEIAHIGLKSAAFGTKPVVGILIGEIGPNQAVPFDWLNPTSNDPPDLPPSSTMYSDRYSTAQNGVCPKCDNFQLATDYGVQNATDETLMFSIYGAKHAERRQQ